MHAETNCGMFWNFLCVLGGLRAQQTFPVTGQVINIFGIADHKVSVTLLCSIAVV